MCGIFGTVGTIDKSLLVKMAETLKHRGPDDVGFFFDDGIGLGNTRLSIIDVKGGHQPVHNEDSTIWITHNGEIYNFQQLRNALSKSGHKFYTNSDTEVIVHAYEEWSTDCVKEFNGMWAFAIWDSNRRLLFISRDRLGIKPVYYVATDKRFTFASEIKALLLDQSVRKMPNDKVIYDYLVCGLVDHAEQTFFRQIKRLMPAHNLLFNECGIQIERYWETPFHSKEIENSDKNDNAYASQFFDLFKESVERQLMSEVPIGTCLSGGLDSSSIACMIAQLLRLDSPTLPQTMVFATGKQKTFTACFKEKQIDEREYADEVITRTAAERNVVYPDSTQFWKDIERLVYSQEEPFTGLSVYAQYCVMKLASQKVKVLLDGQGGDELLTGYIAYHLVFLQDLLKKRKIISFMKELFSSLDILVPHIRHYLFSPRSKQARKMKLLLNDSFRSECASTSNELSLIKYKDLPDLMRRDMTQNNLPALLRYEDKNSMAFSVEARVPFLDYRLVEYASSLPITQKLRNGWTKLVLRNSMKGVLPEKVRKRRKKVAFATPDVTWLRDLEKEIREVLMSPEFQRRRYFRQQEVLKELNEFFKGKSNDSEILWRILNLELWLRIFIDKETREATTE